MTLLIFQRSIVTYPILHPLPRLSLLSYTLTNNPHTSYYHQASSVMFIIFLENSHI